MRVSPSRRAELLARLRNEAILNAEAGSRMVGRTGVQAAWMLYCWPLTMTADGSTLIADELLGVLAGYEATQIAAYGIGAIPLMTACVLRSAGHYTGLTVRSEVKQYGSGRQIEGEGDRGRKVVLVDDSISSGMSFMAAARILEREGYIVEGAVCLVNFSCRGGVEHARARGYRIRTLFDIWDDMQMPRPDRAPLYLRHLPDHWSSERVPDRLHPAQAARRVAEHLIRTGEVLLPPREFADNEEGPGGVWVSFRRRDNDRRLAREGFWHFDPSDADPTRDVVIATAGTVQALGTVLTPQLLSELKIAVSFFSELEPIEPRDLDFGRYGIVVRSQHIPAKMGGALPNTQLFTSSFEQYRHALVTNARIGAFEPHDLFRHDVHKCVEPDERWLAYGEDEAKTDAWMRAPGLGDGLLQRALDVIASERDGTALSGRPLDSNLVPDSVSAVAVSLYDRGLIGCSVTGTGTLDHMLVTATRHALTDARFAPRRRTSHGPVTVTVSLLHDRERHESVGVEYIAWKLRAGRDSFSVHKGDRWAVFLDSVVPHYGWSKQQAAKRLLIKAAIDSERATWVVYKTATWGSIRGRVHRLEYGGRRRNGHERLVNSDVIAMGEHLYRRLDLGGWPASRVIAQLGTYERCGTASRCLHALHTLHEAGKLEGRPEWKRVARSGLDYALAQLDEGANPTLRVPDHSCGPVADAILLGALSAMHDGDTGPLPPRVRGLAERIRSWVRPDGAVLPEQSLASTADADYLPGIALLALARYGLSSGLPLEINWEAIRDWYARRFQQIHPWGLAAWHCQVWPAVARLTGNSSYLVFAFELADWMTERQLRADGSFLTDLCTTGPSWHTACAATGVVAAWRAAVDLGDTERIDRYATSWRGSDPIP